MIEKAMRSGGMKWKEVRDEIGLEISEVSTEFPGEQRLFKRVFLAGLDTFTILLRYTPGREDKPNIQVLAIACLFVKRPDPAVWIYIDHPSLDDGWCTNCISGCKGGEGLAREATEMFGLDLNTPRRRIGQKIALAMIGNLAKLMKKRDASAAPVASTG